MAEQSGTYTVADRLDHDGVRYEPGQQVELTLAQAQQLAATGAIVMPGGVMPRTTDEMSGLIANANATIAKLNEDAQSLREQLRDAGELLESERRKGLELDARLNRQDVELTELRGRVATLTQQIEEMSKKRRKG